MHRRLLTLGLLAALILASAPAQAHGWRWSECRYRTTNGRMDWTTREVKRTIYCAATQFHVSVATAMYVADRESGFGAYAQNPYSGACGVFQNMPRYWAGRQNDFVRQHPRFQPVGESCYNARANVLVSVHMAARQGWGAWGL